MAHKSFIDASREGWGRSDQVKDNFSHNDLQTGCMQRIADACEKMVIDRDKLQNELNVMKECYRSERQTVLMLRERIIIQKGQITRLKNKLNKVK